MFATSRFLSETLKTCYSSRTAQECCYFSFNPKTNIFNVLPKLWSDLSRESKNWFFIFSKKFLYCHEWLLDKILLWWWLKAAAITHGITSWATSIFIRLSDIRTGTWKMLNEINLLNFFTSKLFYNRNWRFWDWHPNHSLDILDP